MKKHLLCLILLTLSPLLLAEEIQRIRTLVRLEKAGNSTHAYMIENSRNLPTFFKDAMVRKAFNNLEEGSEAFIEGYVNYKVSSNDSIKSMEPVFYVESVYPVSLNKLGAVNFSATEAPGAGMMSEKVFEPVSIPVTTEVASAITLTSTLLLMESLSNGGMEPAGQRDLKKALIISSGLMATMLFIYEQIEGKSRP
ncbi:MAG: hypothetical protein ACLGHN_01650 [Bacteriovoracia bacterium]